MNNTFEQHIGRQVHNIYRLDCGEDLPKLSYPIGILFMLDNTSGLTVCFSFYNPTLNISYATLEDFRYDYETEYGETTLNELKDNDTLLKLVGQKLVAVKIGQFKNYKLVGSNFVIKADEYAGIVLEFEKDKVAIFPTEAGGQIMFNTNHLFPNTLESVLT